MIEIRAYSFNGKTALSKSVVPRSSRGGPALLLPLLMKRVLPAPATMLLKRNLALDEFAVFPAPIIGALAFLANQSD